MLQTGCRPEELYRLRGESVNLEQGYLQIAFGKTKAARRKIPLSKAAMEILEHRIAGSKSAYLFPHRDDPNKPTLKVNNAHERALKRCGLKFRLYDLRHTFATRAAMSGVDLVTLAALLGHSRIQMVLRYAHPAEEHKINAIRRLEAFNAEREMTEFQAGDQVN
jgi:integrase